MPAEKIEQAVRVWTTRVNPLHGNGGIHFQLATDQNGNSIQNVRALQIRLLHHRQLRRAGR